jgi:hypothetical protein
MAGHSRPKDGVASARLCPAIHVFWLKTKEDVDARDKPGHDDLDDLHVAIRHHLLAIHFRHPPCVKPPQRLQLGRGRRRKIGLACRLMPAEPT